MTGPDATNSPKAFAHIVFGRVYLGFRYPPQMPGALPSKQGLDMMCVYKLAKAFIGRGFRRSARNFVMDQTGSTTVFAMTLFMLMAMMGGLAVDLMRYEATRTSLQNTLDRATLAAASLNQRVDGKVIVKDYFAKANLTQYLREVTVTNGINFRNVKANASAETNPYFAHLVGVEEMEAKGKSMAEQRTSNVEIMLVLDVSGSMNSNNRLPNLKTAANEFISTVLGTDSEQRISIGIVPFNGQVNLPLALRTKFNFTDPNGVSNVNCFDLPASVYAGSTMSRTTPLSMTIAGDTFSGTSNATNWINITDTSNAAPNPSNVWCPPRTENTVSLPLQNITALRAKVTGLTAIGATSINAGMKWGLAMLDPMARDIYNEYQSASLMPVKLAGRPFEFNDRESVKVIVLMTDGEHFREERVNPGYKSGPSPIWRSNNDGFFSIEHPGVAGTNKFYVPHLNQWQAAKWTNSSNTGTATVQTWPDVWSKMRVSFVAWQFYARALGNYGRTPGDNNWTAMNANYDLAMVTFRSRTAVTDMDTQLQSVCDLAREKDVIVYGIAFEAPTGGQTQIRKCASTPAHYYNASGLQIQTAFRSIATNISQLRLTQ